MPERSSSRYITWIFLSGLILLVGFFFARFFLPLWAWMNIDEQAIAREQGLDPARLRIEYDGIVYYDARGPEDPAAWQIIYTQPVYETEDIYEDEVRVRVHLINGATGAPPGTLMMGTTERDRIRRCRFKRYPAGSLGFTDTRPVCVYDPSSFSSPSIGECRGWVSQLKNFPNDEEIWPERADGWQPTRAAEEPSDDEEEDAPPDSLLYGR